MMSTFQKEGPASSAHTKPTNILPNLLPLRLSLGSPSASLAQSERPPCPHDIRSSSPATIPARRAPCGLGWTASPGPVCLPPLGPPPPPPPRRLQVSQLGSHLPP